MASDAHHRRGRRGVKPDHRESPRYAHPDGELVACAPSMAPKTSRPVSRSFRSSLVLLAILLLALVVGAALWHRPGGPPARLDAASAAPSSVPVASSAGAAAIAES